jgi:serine/threonine protein kinase
MDNLRRIFKKKDPPKPLVTSAEPVDSGKVTKDDFEVLRLLGKGSFAKVVLCRFKRDNKIYAMKVVLKAGLVEHSRVQDVFTEKNILRRSTHPFLLKLHYTFQSDSKLFFVMDFMQGGDLDTYLNKFPNKRVEYDTGRFYAAEILLALQYLHDNHCIYRDLKPENILMSSDGHAVLADFGLSKDFFKEGANPGNAEEGGDSDMRTCSFVGSPFYVAPDVLKQKQYTHTIDYWSYGILVYRMIAGKVPFVGRNMKEVFDAILTQDLRFSSSIVWPAEAKDFITKLLHKDGTKRLCGKAVREHPFFKGVNFEAIEKKSFLNPVPQWTPLPPIEEQFASQPPTAPSTPKPPEQAVEVVNTPIAAPHLPGAQQKLFDGFSYCEDPLNVRGGNSAGSAGAGAHSLKGTVLDT